MLSKYHSIHAALYLATHHVIDMIYGKRVSVYNVFLATLNLRAMVYVITFSHMALHLSNILYDRTGSCVVSHFYCIVYDTLSPLMPSIEYFLDNLV